MSYTDRISLPSHIRINGGQIGFGCVLHPARERWRMADHEIYQEAGKTLRQSSQSGGGSDLENGKIRIRLTSWITQFQRGNKSFSVETAFLFG